MAARADDSLSAITFAIHAYSAPPGPARTRGFCDTHSISLAPSDMPDDALSQPVETQPSWADGAVEAPLTWPNGSDVEQEWNTAKLHGTPGWKLPDHSRRQVAGLRRKRPSQRLRAATEEGASAEAVNQSAGSGRLAFCRLRGPSSSFS